MQQIDPEKVTRLSIDPMSLDDLSIPKFKRLRSLELTDVTIQDGSFFEDLKDFDILKLTNSSIVNIPPLKLRALLLCDLEDISIISKFDLTRLVRIFIKNCPIQNIDFLKVCKSLTMLALEDIKLEDISVVKELSTLESVHLVNCDLPDTSFLKSMPSVTYLKIV